MTCVLRGRPINSEASNAESPLRGLVFRFSLASELFSAEDRKSKNPARRTPNHQVSAGRSGRRNYRSAARRVPTRGVTEMWKKLLVVGVIAVALFAGVRATKHGR